MKSLFKQCERHTISIRFLVQKPNSACYSCEPSLCLNVISPYDWSNPRIRNNSSVSSLDCFPVDLCQFVLQFYGYFWQCIFANNLVLERRNKNVDDSVICVYYMNQRVFVECVLNCLVFCKVYTAEIYSERKIFHIVFDHIS